MHAYTLIGLLVAPCVAAYYPAFNVRQINATTVPSTVETGVQTECKTCPFGLCTNVAAYGYLGYEDGMSLACWTRGDTIVDTKLVLMIPCYCYLKLYVWS